MTHGDVGRERRETVNCSRGAAFSQFNLRVSKGFRLVGTTRIEAIAEVFNLFNARNPAFALTSQQVDAAGARDHPGGCIVQINRDTFIPVSKLMDSDWHPYLG